MTISAIREKLGDYAKDVSINLSKVLTEEGSAGLTKNQIFGAALASAYTTKNTEVIEALLAENVLSEEEKRAAKAASTIMAMNNIYYRFIHLVHDEEYKQMPAGLRMQIILNSGIPKVDFELYGLSVSAINGCGMCMEAHAHEVIKGGISKQGVQSSIKIAAVINSTAQALFIG